MPKSKRSRIVSLTQTSRKGREGKEKLIEEIRDAVEQYSYVYVFELQNSKNNFLKEVRDSWNKRNSRFFFGKNKVMMIALGRSEQDEIKTNMHKISNKLVGFCGIFMTNEDKDTVLKWFSEYSESSHPKSGFVATESFSLPAGPLPQFSHALEPHLRKLGMPVGLENGIVTLQRDYDVCKEGDTLTPEQCNILKLFDVKMSEFKIIMKYYWHDDQFFEIDEN